MLPKEGSRVSVEVFVRNPPVCFDSKVVSIADHSLCIAAPTVNGKKVGVPVGTPIRLSSPTMNGIIQVTSMVERVQSKGTVNWVVRDPGISGINHIDRRDLSRIRVDQSIRWTINREGANQPGEGPMRLLNINSSGALVKVYQDLDLEQEVTLDLTDLLEEEDRQAIEQFIVPARVVRMACLNRYGLQLGRITGETRALFLKTLHRLERKILRGAAPAMAMPATP